MATERLLDLPPDELLARARAVRDAATGTRVTYSPKVFVPLTMLCRDRCGYCTFAQPPARLRPVAPSQGMMVETLRPDLAAHRGSPDKTPERRLATLEAAGRLSIPFTTGILVGIGETRADRLAALEAIAESHRRWGHVQEVIVQNFLPKAGTTMHQAPPCPLDDHLDAIALARLVLPPDVHVQAPPNLADDFGVLLDAGIDDWGGVSPVTADHVNPERPWPALDRLSAVTEARGFELAPRLTIYPEYARVPDRWLDPALVFPVMDRSDAEGLGRDDPGAVFPERTLANAKAGTGADVALTGERSTAWYSGATATPPTIVSGVAGPSATWSPTYGTATSTTPTSARSSAASAGSPRARCRSTCGARPTCSPSTTSPSGPGRPGNGAPSRCACRAASIPTSTATTTSTWPGR